jgi:hypothetical protein
MAKKITLKSKKITNADMALAIINTVCLSGKLELLDKLQKLSNSDMANNGYPRIY